MGSLGLSDEFRYMQTLLPATTDQTVYLYLSDPFIRKMVGPRTKIAQYRRSIAATRLKLITAASLLYQLDYQRIPTLKILLEQHYIDKDWLAKAQIHIDKQGVVHSKIYGTLAHMSPLSMIPIEQISSNEKEAYESYVKNYNKFWKKYFDPIAMRLKIGEKIALETVILPLIKNSSYQNLRKFAGDSVTVLDLDIKSPKTISILSANIKTAKQQIFKHQLNSNYKQDFKQLLNYLGDSAHLVIFDNKPLLTWGSMDLLGVFSIDWQLGREFQVILLPLVASLFTQPSAIVIDLNTEQPLTEKEDVKLLLKLFERKTTLLRERVEISQVASENSWVLTWNLLDIVKLHLYLYLTNTHIILSNQPVQMQMAQTKPTMDKNHFKLKLLPKNIDKIRPLFNLHQAQLQQQLSFKNGDTFISFNVINR